MAAQVSNCGGDENGRLWGGQAGDQTGREYKLAPWSYWGQTAVYRHPNAQVRATLARKARAAALNDLVGYDQGQRLTFYQHLKASGWDPAKITVACEADCSSSTGALIVATGHELGSEKLKAYDYTLSTNGMDEALRAAGFTRLTGSKYLASGDHLLAGDIQLLPAYHVNVVVTGGTDKDDAAGELPEVAWYREPQQTTFAKATYVRSMPSTKAAHVAQYAKGTTVLIDGITLAEGYVWGTYVGGSGARRWVSLGTTERAQ